MQPVTEANITDLAVARWGTAHDPRLAEIMTALVRHLHEFAREVRLTEAEWIAAMQWLTRTGQISRRQADGVHPRLRRARPVDARRADEPPVRRAGHARDGARPVPHRRVTRARVTAGTCPKASRDSRSTSTGSSATSTATRSPAPCSTCGRPTPTARTRPSSRWTRPRLRAQVHDARRRQLLRADHRAEGLHHPDGRPGRRPHQPHRHQPLPPGARALPRHGSGLRAAHHSPVRAGRPIPRQRRGLRDEGRARRPLRAARVGDGARRRASPGPWTGATTTSCCSRRRRSRRAARTTALTVGLSTAGVPAGTFLR